jgi:dipeptidyl aminopeptidase/acylaminoacyl peptidase
MALPTALPTAPVATLAPSPFGDFTTPVVPSDRYSPGESFLFAGLRSDIIGFSGPACVVRRTGLPVGATDGVECALAQHPDVDRVGAYLFPDAATGQAAYDARLAEHGIAPSADGGCPPGSLATDWPAEQRPRSACFVNDAGIANLRIYWPGPHVLVGVLGQHASVSGLLDWARGWRDGPTAGFLDPWLWGAGATTAFVPCDEVQRPERIPGPATLSYEQDGLWLTDPMGTDERKLPTRGDQAPAYGSAWSPDGRRLAYLTRIGERGDVWLLDPDTGDEVRVATADGYFALDLPEAIEWSPDGRFLAYTVWSFLGTEDQPEYRPAVWLVGSDGGGARQAAHGFFSAWAPDSSSLLVIQPDLPLEYPQHQTGALVAVDLAGGPETLLARASRATWSHDCSQVLLEASTRSGAIVIGGVGGRPWIAIDADIGQWSPVSPVLLVGTARSEEVWRISLDDGKARSLGKGTFPVWSDDGTSIAYTSPDGLRIMASDGSGSRVVANHRYPLGSVRWSPDGRWIAASWEMTYDTCGPRLWGWMIATDGSAVRELPSPFHARWRPTEPPKPAGDLTGDDPPIRGEGCGA